ncbi:helix-turn-helix domain-containing protein [Actinopolymorpha alba]|uniref:helix-turn-helix domain-containing protein n=1 Tax=Actinopolymorpha alba TaxID=533267 RepID=UPI000369DE38|nr:helix-turn-helix transcriptional regulator [Actinopolymorpha alba]
MGPSAPARRVAHDQARLGEMLLELRHRAGLSGIEAGRRAGMSQSKISRLESASRLPNLDDIRTLCAVYNASPSEQEALIRLAADILEVSKRSRVVMPRGAAQLQSHIGRMERTASLVRSFSPAVVLGILQTPAYTREIMATALSGDDLDEAVAARIRRKAALGNEGRRFRLVMTEGALRWLLGAPAVMVEQIEAIAEASRMPNVAIGIIPWMRPMTTFCTHSFDIYDSTAAVVGTEANSVPFGDPADVESYERAFARLEAVASFGEDARRELARIGSDYRLLA